VRYHREEENLAAGGKGALRQLRALSRWGSGKNIKELISFGVIIKKGRSLGKVYKPTGGLFRITSKKRVRKDSSRGLLPQRRRWQATPLCIGIFSRCPLRVFSGSEETWFLSTAITRKGK